MTKEFFVPHAVIVDGYSGGVHLAPEFNKRGISCLHVQSDSKIWPLVEPTFDYTPYREKLYIKDGFEALIQKLKNAEVVAVLPGTETGVELADQISEALMLPSNGTKLSEARRNKFLMIETCRQADIPVADQFCADNLPALLSWHRASGLKNVIVKPLNSAGTDGVFKCQTSSDLEKAFHRIYGKENKLALNNDLVLVQEFLQGTEYFIDSVSKNGQHAFTDIWKYKKRSINGHDFVYDKNDLCAYDDPTVVLLRAYVVKVLNALNIQNGPAHAEVMMTEKGPRLVEIGARLDGVTIPQVNRICVGFSPVDTTIDAFLSVDDFSKVQKNGYAIGKHASTVYLTAYQERFLKSFTDETILKNLPSFHQMTLRMKLGGKIYKTVNYFTAPGVMTLIHADRAVIESDYLKIRELENSNQLLEITPEMPL